jgi:CheY-like chemotaxis protein
MKTVLVVEDDPCIGELLTDVLQLAGYRSLLADDGVDGLTRVRETRPDMVLCDAHLPRIDGMGVARALRAEPTLQATPFILMSADSRYVAEQAGDQTTLLKPIDLQTLLDTVAAQIGQPA